MFEEKEDAGAGDKIIFEADERDWARTRPDGLAISRKTKTLIIMEYKRRSDTWPDYKQRGEKAANKQYEKVRKALEGKGADTGWTIKQVKLVMSSISQSVFPYFVK